jgi:predicted SAM-dependent methyltransferase
MVKELIKLFTYDTETDPMWQAEVEKLIPWLFGKGADIGCGKRSPLPTSIRVDIDKKVDPEILAKGDDLPFKDEELDYISAVHNFEHYDNQKEVLTEWLRCLKKGGIIAIVHPDVNYTKKQNPEINNPDLRENPYNKHYHEHTQESFLQQLEVWSELGFRVIDKGTACGNWSFYVILKKI